MPLGTVRHSQHVQSHRSWCLWALVFALLFPQLTCHSALEADGQNKERVSRFGLTNCWMNNHLRFCYTFKCNLVILKCPDERGFKIGKGKKEKCSNSLEVSPSKDVLNKMFKVEPLEKGLNDALQIFFSPSETLFWSVEDAETEMLSSAPNQVKQNSSL